MKKNYSIAASCVTVGELRKLLEDLPQDYKVTFCGEAEGFINVLGADGYITLDHTNDYMEEYTDDEPKRVEGNTRGICPNCGMNIENNYCDMSIDGDEVHHYFVCPKCGGAGSEEYTLQFISNSVIIDFEIDEN